MEIQTPRGKILVNSKTMKAQIAWNPNFAAEKNAVFGLQGKVQKIIDSEVLRGSEPYTPLKTSMLVKSGTLGTTIGSGTVSWIAPYARRQYYEGRMPGVSQTGALRGRMWFERWKADKAAGLIARIQQMAGGS